MRFVAYCEGMTETQKEIDIFNDWGQIEIDPTYSFPTWIIEFTSFSQLFKLSRQLEAKSYRTWLPNVNGDFPIVAFYLDKKLNLD